MAEHKIACPQCSSALKSRRPVPAGMKVKCPRCGLLFSAPPAEAQAPAMAVAVQAAQPAAAMAATAAPVAAPYIPMPQAPAAAPRKSGALWVFGGGALLLMLAALLVVLCFSGDEPRASAPTGGGTPVVGEPPPKPKPKPLPPLITLTPEEQKLVDAAVKKGIDHLKKRQNPDGTWPGSGSHPWGYATLAGLTLLECGVPHDDEAIQRTARYVRKAVPGLTRTYELSLSVLFLAKLGDPADKPLVQLMTMRLVAGQTHQGGWSYNCPNVPKAQAEGLHAALEQVQRHDPAGVRGDPKGGKGAPEQFRHLAVFAGKPPPNQRDDNSNTQFATLAMLAARAQGMPVDATLALIEKRFRASQKADGSWRYEGERNASAQPTMTCAGLLGLAVGFGIDKDAHKKGLKPEDDPMVKKGLQHLSKSVGAPDPRGGKPKAVQLYFLWSVERVAVLYHLKTVEGKQWYHWGMEMLLAHQRAEGDWRIGNTHGSNDVHDTAFALLFLRRVNLATDLTDELHELRERHAPLPPAKKD